MVKISRHARNNMKLYEVAMSELSGTINFPDIIEPEGDRVIVCKYFNDRFSGYPLKVVYEKKEEDFFVITAYPLKRTYRR
jgi:hypothetical protein